jgi:putative selenate reductase molybdopterin-binding subunit
MSKPETPTPTPGSSATQAPRVVKKSERKIDAVGLALGRPAFTDDVTIPGMLHAKVLWSPHAHARLIRIDTREAEALPGVHCVVACHNVPRVLHTTAGQGFPEPSPYDTGVFDEKVRFVGDRVAAVAAETRAIAERAARLIEVEYELLEPVFDIRAADADGAPVIHDEADAHAVIPVAYHPERNVAAHVETTVGDPDAALSQSPVTVQVEVETQYGQHCPLEPHVTICYLDANDRLVIRTSTQVPYHVRRIVAQALQIPVRRVRVIKPRIGGGFGVKQEVLEAIPALLCLRTRRPVKLEYTRAEELVSSRTRHPAVVSVAAAFEKDGTLNALKMRARTNTGAYGSHALTVVSNCGSKTLPLYRCDNIGFVGDSVYTNLPVGGAYRGYGATQAAFALEVAMDEAAEKLAIDPVDLRKNLHIKQGETSPVFRALGEGKEGVDQSIGSCALDACLQRGAEAIGWKEKRERRDSGRYRRGVGMCALMQGSSIPEIDMGAATLKINDDGSFNLLVGATDLGTGSDTVLAQIAAEALGTTLDKMLVYSSDTDLTPFDVGAYASSTTYLSGEAVRRTALDVREQIIDVAAEMLGAPREEVTIGESIAEANGKQVSYEAIARHALYAQNQFQIGAINSAISHVSPPPFSAHFAEVEVDTETGRTRVLHYVAAVDCGTPINPKLAEGQVEGAVVNGLGYALTEELTFSRRGECLNPSFRHYRIPSSADIPKLETILVDSYEPTGPYGAKSISEICINGPLPTLSNAIAHAVGVRLYRSPFSAERLFDALQTLKG